ncbi:MAG TPA: hypothetical protein VGE06_02585 [Flavisolibacter sp.]
MALQTDYKIEKASVADFNEITAVWEASVRATHHFLAEDDILFFKPLIREQYLFAVDVYCIRDEEGRIPGFLGTSSEKVEDVVYSSPEPGKGPWKGAAAVCCFYAEDKSRGCE